MADPLVRYQPTPLQVARDDLDWLSDEDVAFLEPKDQAAAVGLSLLCGGGGYFYTGDHGKGVGLTLAAVASLLILPGPLAVLGFAAMAAVGAVTSRAKVKKINKFVIAKREEESRIGAAPGAYRLLSAMSKVDTRAARDAAVAVQVGAFPVVPQPPPPPDPGLMRTPSRHPELIDKLRKLATLRGANVISELELKERKIDMLSEVATGLDRGAVDDLLFDLVPLLHEGAVTDEDVDFVKSLAK
jgi:hypothetical protein